MQSAVRRRIFDLLEAIRDDFPRRKRVAEALFGELGLKGEHRLEVQAPAPAEKIPTFDPSVVRPLSPMLQARFDHSGAWRRGQELWLTPAEMVLHIGLPEVKTTHVALRRYWEGSAPMSFSDDRLAILGITEGVSQDITYLVWSSEDDEPEIWEYCGQTSDKFANLEQYLIWCLERD